MPATLTESELTNVTPDSLSTFIRERLANLLAQPATDTFTTGTDRGVAFQLTYSANDYDKFGIETRVTANLDVNERLFFEWNEPGNTPTTEANASRFCDTVRFTALSSIGAVEVNHPQAKLLLLFQGTLSQVLGFFRPERPTWWDMWPYAFVPWNQTLVNLSSCSAARSPFNLQLNSGGTDYALGLHSTRLENMNPRSLRREYYQRIPIYSPSSNNCGSCGSLNEEFVMFAGEGVKRGDRPVIDGNQYYCIKGGVSAIGVRI
ncbi:MULTISPECIES: hypothetical protein [unclassified Coleofasciculus]|uniref:hypothetical protein n=1 Tax=unclassified Coleofasciculus TaxID=2692782 RepID=UPI001882CEAF|nr:MULTISPECIES: hypothetical protein [unclassified Coleofasciculus]MBE9130054.1 hypothetical protein [Coleofasciculus sp. LEGE 07081]MBE9152438.1 hypothetical protein [Coleofasciculus sp. LEGE 07092]